MPTTIENEVIDYVQNFERRNYNRIVIAAPIKLGSDSCYLGVMVQRDHAAQRLYIHNVIAEKETRMPFTTGLATNGSKDTRGTQRLYITNIIQRALNVKVKFTAAVDMELFARNGAFKPRCSATCSQKYKCKHPHSGTG